MRGDSGFEDEVNKRLGELKAQELAARRRASSRRSPSGLSRRRTPEEIAVSEQKLLQERRAAAVAAEEARQREIDKRQQDLENLRIAALWTELGRRVNTDCKKAVKLLRSNHVPSVLFLPKEGKRPRQLGWVINSVTSNWVDRRTVNFQMYGTDFPREVSTPYWRVSGLALCSDGYFWGYDTGSQQALRNRIMGEVPRRIIRKWTIQELACHHPAEFLQFGSEIRTQDESVSMKDQDSVDQIATTWRTALARYASEQTWRHRLRS